tara:strand:- start:538 stop:1512 length:975 start_codon:yes stop_codon:yes gene_type:complete
MNKIKLKGGSLSSTYLCRINDHQFVRKTINLDENREYGYVRWYSQLKKIQRFNSLLPDLFPRVLNVSFLENEAFFDIEYFENYKDLKSLLLNEDFDNSQISKINKSLWAAFDMLHSNKLNVNSNSSTLYFKEEVLTKLKDALKYKIFDDFTHFNNFKIDNKVVPNLINRIDEIENTFSNISLSSEEYIHGNPTLENTLYSIDEDRIIFIDLYEESVIDSKLLDYSQVLQCSRSLYGLINDNDVVIDENICSHDNKVPSAMKLFNALFLDELRKREVDMITIDLLEASQFIRMLPFKCAAGEYQKAKYFYVHACQLFDKVLESYG